MEPHAASERDAVAAGSNAPQEEFFAQLVVVLPVDHGQAHRGCAPRQVHNLDVELVVELHAGHQVAVRITIRAHGRRFVEGHRVGLAVLVQRSKRPVHVKARDDHEPHTGGQRLEDQLGVGARQRAAVDRGVGFEIGQVFAMRRELRPLYVQVLHGRHVGGLQVAAVDDQHVMARGGELLDDGAPDEPNTMTLKLFVTQRCTAGRIYSGRPLCLRTTDLACAVAVLNSLIHKGK